MFFAKESVIAVSISGAVLAYFFYISYDIYVKRKKYRHIPGPPANGLVGFYLGNLREIATSIGNGVMYSDLINEW